MWGVENPSCMQENVARFLVYAAMIWVIASTGIILFTFSYFPGSSSPNCEKLRQISAPSKPSAPVSRTVLMVVDALRYDMALGSNSEMV